ncbi:MAG: class I SAM-dependent methyltransferase [Desulfobacteraceae bacterium]|jgi:SAM-dependent methyltransferase
MTSKRKNEFDCVETVCMICGAGESSVVARGKDYEYRTSERDFTFVACSTCGHVYLNPRPGDHCLHLAYPDNYYTVSGRHTSRQSAIIARLKSFVIKRRLRFFQELLKGRGRILEVGCGDGVLLVDLKTRNPQLDLVGLDLALGKETIKRCKAMGITLMETSVEQADLGHDRYDLIIVNQVIEHVPDPAQVMQNLAKALKHGGYISIETPNRDGYDHTFFRRSFWGGYYFPRHLHLFDRDGLKSCVENSGLTVVYQGYLLAPIIWIFSIHALLSHGLNEGRTKEMMSEIFSDRNPFCLAVFTLVDLLARLAGFPTSNQKIIGRKY